MNLMATTKSAMEIILCAGLMGLFIVMAIIAAMSPDTLESYADARNTQIYKECAHSSEFHWDGKTYQCSLDLPWERYR